jgi:hypothetical protein
MRRITLLAILLSPLISWAQIDFGSPAAAAGGGSVTATAQGWEAIEINPSNLGWASNHIFSMSIANVGINMQDNALNVHDILNIGNGLMSSKNLDSISLNSQTGRQLYNAVTAPGGFNANATVTLAAFSFSIPKIGGFAVNLTDEMYAHVYLNPQAADVFFNGVNSQLYQEIFNNVKSIINSNNYSQDSILANAQLAKQEVAQAFQGSSFGGYHYRELNIDFGRKLLTIKMHSTGKGGASYENREYVDYKQKTSDTLTYPIEIFGGFGFKPVWGLADYTALITGGQFTANGTSVNNYPAEIVQGLPSSLFHANGRGYGVDLGLSATYKKWKLGISAIDLGKITWQNNSFTRATVSLPPLDSASGIYKQNNFAILQDFIKQTQTPEPNYNTDLPSKFRSGISYQLSRGILLSSDFVVPLNSVQGNIQNPYFAIGAHIRFFQMFYFSVGAATEKGFGNVVPFGIFVNLIGDFQLFVATNDVLAYFPNSNSRVLSLSAGIKLFGF